MKKILFIILIICTILKVSLAQEKGYIIKNDTVKQGYIIDRSDKLNMNTCIYKSYLNGKEQVLTSEQISEYGIDNENIVFESHILEVGNETKNVFLKKINYSESPVYKYADKSGNYYFSKVNGEFVSINNEELQRIIELSKEKNRSKFKSDLTVDIYSGINMGDLDYNTAIVKRSKTASSDGFTIGFNINKPFKNNWHIMSGLNFTKHNYSVIDPYKLSCNFWSLNLPLLINYSINFNGLNISPMAGTLFIYRNLKENELSAEITLYEEYNSSFHTLNYSYSNELLKTYNVGMNYGIVVLYKAFSIAYSQNRYFEHNLDYVENQIVLSFRLKQAK